MTYTTEENNIMANKPTELTVIRHAIRALIENDGLSCRWGYTTHQMRADIRINLTYLEPSDLIGGFFDCLALRA